ncbi:Leucine Rich repeats (2 copies) [Symmachiella dynata]|uniref:Leucine Rich repeats (2 copies) n=2 Tax=Symmachiella dynata TaxID=2527995 RepID=A0A517ZPK4_9PLAN|nr:Leucine Rich repeats (2 copies) [Symmachiella dynata]
MRGHFTRGQATLLNAIQPRSSIKNTDAIGPKIVLLCWRSLEWGTFPALLLLLLLSMYGDFMNAPQSAPESTTAPSPRRKKWVFKILLAIVLLVLLVPIALQGLAGFSPVVDVRNKVSSLGGTIQTAVAAPEFLQSIVGKDWAGWDRFYGGIEVDQVGLNQSLVEDQDLALLQQTPGLRTLKLQTTRITDAGIQHLSSVPQLQKLDLGGTEITNAGLDHLQSLEELQELAIADTAVSDDGIAKLAGLKTLTVLDASGTNLTDASLKTLSEIPILKTLKLDGCNLTDEGLTVLKNCKSLTSLSLDEIPLTGSFLKELQGVPLEDLSLAHTNCDGTMFTDAGELKTLKTLSLSHCPVEEAGIASIAALSGLETLSLDNTKINEGSVAGLKGMPQLRILSINSTPTTADTLRELKGMPKLKLVIANKTQVSRGDVDALGAEIESFSVLIVSSGGGG